MGTGKVSDLRQSENVDVDPTSLTEKKDMSGKSWRERHLLHPNEIGNWDLIMMICLFYTAIGTPFEVAFFGGRNNDDFVGWALWVINRSLDFLFSCDIFLQFFMKFEDSTSGQVIDDTALITAKYVRGWLCVDVFSTFPFEVCADVAMRIGSQAVSNQLAEFRIFRLLRLLRLVKLLRILRASRIVGRWETQLGLTHAFMQLVKFLMLVFLLSHWFACGFRMIPSIFDSDTTTNWMVGYGLDDTTPNWTVYVSALYWSVMTLTTIGYGDVTAQTHMERGFSIIAMAVGGAVYAYIVGGVCGIVATMGALKTAHYQTMDNLNMYMEDKHLPTDMRERLRSYFDHCKGTEREKYYHYLLERMSPMLRGEVAAFCFQDWILKVPYFSQSHADEKNAFVMEIAVSLKPETFAPWETIVRAGEQPRFLCIIRRGIVVQLHGQFETADTGASLMTAMNQSFLTVGSFFGDDIILFNHKRRFSAKAFQFYVDVFTLDQAKLWSIIGDGRFPKTANTIRKLSLKMAFQLKFVLFAKKFHKFRKKLAGVDKNEQKPAAKNLDVQLSRFKMTDSSDKSTELENLEEDVTELQASLKNMDDRVSAFMTDVNQKLDVLLDRSTGQGFGSSERMVFHAEEEEILRMVDAEVSDVSAQANHY